VGFFSGALYQDKPTPTKKTSLPDFDPSNPQTFFDIHIGEEG